MTSITNTVRDDSTFGGLSELVIARRNVKMAERYETVIIEGITLTDLQLEQLVNVFDETLAPHRQLTARASKYYEYFTKGKTGLGIVTFYTHQDNKAHTGTLHMTGIPMRLRTKLITQMAEVSPPRTSRGIPSNT